MDSLRRLSKRKDNEVWMALSREIGAEYVKGGFWRSDKVVAAVKEWAITFENYSEDDEYSHTEYTCVIAPYVSTDGFPFKIYRYHKSAFNKLSEFLGKYFGMQKIKVWYPEFDRDFIITGNNEFKIRELFANSLIRQLIQSLMDGSDSSSGILFRLDSSELSFRSNNVIKDVARLKDIYVLFKETLKQLRDVESA